MIAQSRQKICDHKYNLQESYFAISKTLKKAKRDMLVDIVILIVAINIELNYYIWDIFRFVNLATLIMICVTTLLTAKHILQCKEMLNTNIYLWDQVFEMEEDLENHIKNLMSPIRDKQTSDQIAKIMLLHGTPEQQEEALSYCGIDKNKLN